LSTAAQRSSKELLDRVLKESNNRLRLPDSLASSLSPSGISEFVFGKAETPPAPTFKLTNSLHSLWRLPKLSEDYKQVLNRRLFEQLKNSHMMADFDSTVGLGVERRRSTVSEDSRSASTSSSSTRSHTQSGETGLGAGEDEELPGECVVGFLQWGFKNGFKMTCSDPFAPIPSGSPTQQVSPERRAHREEISVQRAHLLKRKVRRRRVDVSQTEDTGRPAEGDLGESDEVDMPPSMPDPEEKNAVGGAGEESARMLRIINGEWVWEREYGGDQRIGFSDRAPGAGGRTHTTIQCSSNH